MRHQEFYKKFGTDRKCRVYLKAKREDVGVWCKNCDHNEHYWHKGKESFQCKKCGFRTSLRNGTIMQASKLPIKTWFECIHLMTATKKGVSALEMQRQLGLKRYEPVWYMMQKIRVVMGLINCSESLQGTVEIDDAFFNVDSLNKDKDEPPKRGRGSQKKQPVVLMVETASGKDIKGWVGKLKAFSVERLDGESILNLEALNLEKAKGYKTDGYSIYHKLDKTKHRRFKVPPHLAGVILPWVHIAISNFKRAFHGIYHHMNTKYLQDYLDEMVFKFNNRHCKNRFNSILINGLHPFW